jgi:hypothetical protein
VPGINVLRGGLNAILAWCALMGCILTYTVAWQWDKKHHPYWDSEFYAYRQMMTTVRAPFFCVAAGSWRQLA